MFSNPRLDILCGVDCAISLIVVYRVQVEWKPVIDEFGLQIKIKLYSKRFCGNCTGLGFSIPAPRWTDDPLAERVWRLILPNWLLSDSVAGFYDVSTVRLWSPTLTYLLFEFFWLKEMFSCIELRGLAQEIGMFCATPLITVNPRNDFSVSLTRIMTSAAHGNDIQNDIITQM